jgi:GT2 family glycosyltransferase
MYEREVSKSPDCMENITVDQVVAAIEKQFSAKKIAIVLLTYDCLESTKKTIDSIRSFHDYQIFVVDNSSTDGTQEWLKAQGIKFVSKKMSVTKAQNEGIRMALAAGAFDYFMILNNDVILSSTYLDVLVETIERRKCIAATGHVIDSRDPYAHNFSSMTYQTETKLAIMVAGDFSAVLFSPEALKKVGALDEQFHPRYQEDEDYFLRLRLAGGEIIKTLRTTFHHVLGTTLAKHGEDKTKFGDDWNRNTEKFKRKWGFDPYAQRNTLLDLPKVKQLSADWESKIFIPIEEAND